MSTARTLIRTHPVALLGVIAVWLLIDLWRMFTPSLITLFGRAAETPAEVMGAYALGVMAAPLLLLAFVRRPAALLAAGLLVAAFVVRLVLRVNPDGGDVQLYGASLGVALAVASLCLIAGIEGRSLLPSVMAGLALSVTTHAALGSFGAVWRSDFFDISLLIFQALLLLAAVRAAVDDRAAHRTAPLTRPSTEPAGWRTGLLLFPALLVLQLAFSNVGRGSTVDLTFGPLTVVVGTWVALAVALLPRPHRRPWAAAAVLIAATVVTVPLEVTRAGIEGQLSLWSLAAFLVGPAALVRVLHFDGLAGKSSRHTSLMAGLGAVIWTVFLFAFYAGYDLGYRADWAIVALVALSCITVLWQRGVWFADCASLTAVLRGTAERRMLGVVGGFAAAAVALTLFGPMLTIRPLESAEPSTNEPSTSELNIAAYNLRMGYGIDGRFNPIEVAQQLMDNNVQLAMLSEVDRGWLLNGGQDQLAILARLTGMQFVFGPAGDQVWGDVILTSLPLSDIRSERMPKFDALTSAAMTFATADWNGREIQFISTHLQPDADEETVRQAGVFAQALSDGTSRGPVIGGGDLNTEPGSAAWGTLLASGAEDSLAKRRPSPTWSADNPSQQIDHVFISGVDLLDARVVDSLLSDHLMVLITIR